MNYYNVFSASNNYSPSFSLNCCAVGEAYVNHFGNDVDPEQVVNEVIGSSLFQNRGWIIWTLLPDPDYAKGKLHNGVMELVLSLPNTTYLGAEKNLNTGRVVHVLVTNLIKEW